MRHGDDLVCDFEVSLLEALTGFRTSMRHLDGQCVNLGCERQVTRPGQLRRVRGWGMPRRKAGGKGDLLLRFAVRFPSEPLAAEASRCSLSAPPEGVHPGLLMICERTPTPLSGG